MEIEKKIVLLHQRSLDQNQKVTKQMWNKKNVFIIVSVGVEDRSLIEKWEIQNIQNSSFWKGSHSFHFKKTVIWSFCTPTEQTIVLKKKFIQKWKMYHIHVNCFCACLSKSTLWLSFYGPKEKRDIFLNIFLCVPTDKKPMGQRR